MDRNEIGTPPLLGTGGKACRAIAALLCAMVAVWFVHMYIGRSLIRLLYDGSVPDIFKNIVYFNQARSVEHYFRIGDAMVFRSLMVLASCISVSLLFYQNIIRRKTVHVLFLIFSFMVAQATVSAMSTLYRVYSAHGFFHVSILYQILNGSVPPTDPLLAGYPLHYPWGYEFLVGHLSQIFGISPFYTYAMLNCCALGAFVLLIYKIVCFFVADNRARIFATFISVCASTVWPRYVLKEIIEFAHLTRGAAEPAIHKFFNINAMPFGQVFFFWSVYLLMRVFAGRMRMWPVVLLFISSLGCGFFYPGFLPCILGVVVVMAVGRLLLKKSFIFSGSFKPVVFAFIAVVLACLCIWPYMTSTTSCAMGYTQLFSPIGCIQNIIKYVLVTFPLVIIIFTNRRYLREHCLVPELGVLLAVLITTSGCYLFVHVLNGAEYKFFFLALVALAIPGGVAFFRLRDRLHLAVFTVLICLFLLPVGTDINFRIHRMGNLPLHFFKRSPIFIEDGVTLRHRLADHDQLYKWVLANTSVDAVFIDTSWDVPVYARRRLYVVMATSDDYTQRGYGLDVSDLIRISRCDPAVYGRRMKVVHNIFGYDDSIDRKEILDILRKNKIYVIARSDELPSKFNSDGLKEVFRSSGGGLKVYVREPERVE